MIDFDQEWYAHNALRPAPGNVAEWNERSKTFDNVNRKSDYGQEFLELAAVLPGESVLDMGCGTGILAVELAREGHEVFAADFSEGMLSHLQEKIDEENLETIEPLKMSWDDDWSRFGLDENSVDVAFASRSIIVEDLGAALDKLSRVARRRCCITLATSVSPKLDYHLLAAIGVTPPVDRDPIYAFGMLMQRGYEPEVRYIHSLRKDTFDSKAEVIEKLSSMIDASGVPLSADERAQAEQRLQAWVDAHLVDNPDAGKLDRKGVPEGLFCLDVVRTVSWSFISWDTTTPKAYH